MSTYGFPANWAIENDWPSPGKSPSVASKPKLVTAPDASLMRRHRPPWPEATNGREPVNVRSTVATFEPDPPLDGLVEGPVEDEPEAGTDVPVAAGWLAPLGPPF